VDIQHKRVTSFHSLFSSALDGAEPTTGSNGWQNDSTLPAYSLDDEPDDSSSDDIDDDLDF
jgi:hypothetical protein